MEDRELMGRPKRHQSTASAATPEALSARLPEDLRTFEGVSTPSDYLALRAHVVDWLNATIGDVRSGQATAPSNHAAPGRGHDLAAPVLDAAGLSAANYYRKALTDAT